MQDALVALVEAHYSLTKILVYVKQSEIIMGHTNIDHVDMEMKSGQTWKTSPISTFKYTLW